MQESYPHPCIMKTLSLLCLSLSLVAALPLFVLLLRSAFRVASARRQALAREGALLRRPVLGEVHAETLDESECAR